MPLKTILAIIQSEEDAERVSNCAGTLAARHEAHLIGLHAEALPIPYTSTIGFPDAEFIQASTEVNQERSKKIEAVFRQRTAEAGITAEWRSLESFSGDSAHSGIASARSCDLVVAGQAGSDGASPDVDALLYDAGRPVLVTPHDAPCLASFRRVIVHTEASGGLATDDVVRNRLAATGADLLVLGAYSHSWLRELLFGGVTRTVLHSMPVTAFLSR